MSEAMLLKRGLWGLNGLLGAGILAYCVLVLLRPSGLPVDLPQDVEPPRVLLRVRDAGDGVLQQRRQFRQLPFQVNARRLHVGGNYAIHVVAGRMLVLRIEIDAGAGDLDVSRWNGDKPVGHSGLSVNRLERLLLKLSRANVERS